MARKRSRTIRDTQFSAARDMFLAAKESEGLSRRTLEVYGASLARFGAWLQSEHITNLAELTAQDVRRYILTAQRQGLSAAYVHGLVRPVKTLLRFLHTEGVLQSDVFATVAMPRLTVPVLPAFTAEHVKRLLVACDDSQEPERDKAIVLVLLDTGLRPGELCALTVGDVDTHTGVVTVRRGKGGKGRYTYLGARSKRAVLRYLLERGHVADNEPLFPSAATGEHLTPNSLLQLCRRLGRRADVPNSHPHTYRRTMAIACLRAGMDLQRLALILGHSNLATVRRYLAIDSHDLQTAHREHGPVDAMLKGGKR